MNGRIPDPAASPADDWPVVPVPADPAAPDRFPGGLTVRQAGYLALAAIGAGLCLTVTTAGLAAGAAALAVSGVGGLFRWRGRPVDGLLAPAAGYLRRRCRR